MEPKPCKESESESAKHDFNKRSIEKHEKKHNRVYMHAFLLKTLSVFIKCSLVL